ncbi:MAG: sulfatase-like hydrolase/transferase [Saprospiraceae bacterium]
MSKWLFVIVTAIVLVSCNKDEDPVLTVETNDPPNILMIIADDLGKDALNGFSEGSIKPNTPHIDAIRNDGLSFSNFWVNPTCTPTRASIITGKYGLRTDVKWASDELAQSEVTLQKYISQETSNTYATGLVGKWHLTGDDANVNPESYGIDYYAGLLRGTVLDYFDWSLTEAGSTSQQTSYITEAFTDKSIEWVAEQTKPWFLWLAYNAPHTPFHAPPSNMHSQGNLPAYVSGTDANSHYMAAIEAMDFQIGRLLDNIPTEQRDNTIIIFLGDNGTPIQVAQSPYSSRRSKGSIFQGGINVPLFISGKGVSRLGIDENLISGTDLFATIAEIAGAGITSINDSKSFSALLTEASTIRSFQYSEMDDGTDDLWAIRNDTYKLIVNANGEEAMYNLLDDPYEQSDLLTRTLTASEANAKSALEAELAAIRS